MTTVSRTHPHGTPCRSCGACCATNAEWPRFTTEDERDLEMIPRDLVDDGLGRMRCVGDRCAALEGTVGTATRCTIYPARPDVCRACEPGDEACRIARIRHGLPVLTAPESAIEETAPCP